LANRLLQTVVVGFFAGALGVLLFHQIAVLIFHLLGIVPAAPYSLAPTPPLGVPEFLSAAFWGGVWGIALVLLMHFVRSADRLWVAVLFGAVLLPLAHMLVVVPLKGPGAELPITPAIIAFALVVNGAWGLGTFLFYRLARRWIG
jgi:hypothetical protein